MEQAKGRIPKMWSSLVGWLDERFPVTETWEYHLSKYYAPKNHISGI